MVALIDSLEQQLQQSQQLNFIRWPIMNTYVHQNPTLWGSYQAEVQNVRRFIKERIAWMDKKLNYTYVPQGIADAVNNPPTDDRYYDMQGRLVTHPTKGLYIVNGRKVLIK